MYSREEAVVHRLLFTRSIILFFVITGGMFTEGANLIIYSQILEISTLRFFRFLANGSFTFRASELIQYLNDRGYNLSFVKKEIQRVHSIARNETLPIRLPQPNSVAFHLLSHTILHFVPYQVSYKDTLKSFRPSRIQQRPSNHTSCCFQTNRQP